MDSKVKSTADALLRLTLRMLPLLPAPELYDVIRSVRRTQDDVDKCPSSGDLRRSGTLRNGGSGPPRVRG